MHIAIVTDAWVPQVNGVVRTLTTTIRHLEAAGHTVEVIDPLMFRGFRLKFLPGLRIALPPYGLRARLDRADMIHIATEGPLGLAAKICCERAGYRYTTAFHTNFPKFAHAHWGISERLTFAMMRWFHKRSAAVMVPTESMIAELRAHGFENCAYWGRGVDTSLFYAAPPVPEEAIRGLKRPLWLNVGRVSREKNLDAFLALDLPGTKVIVGAGPDKDRLEGLYPEAKFLGPRSGVALAEIYRSADVFVFPSRFDTFGLVNAEAIVSGTPVAAFPVTGPRDIVKPGVSGFLNDDLEAACMDCLTLGRVTDDFSWEAATKQFFALLVTKLPE